MHPRLRGLAAALVVCVAGVHPAAAQSAEHVAVVINQASETSKRIGEYYAGKRALPAANVIRITAPVAETIERAAYAVTIEAAVAAHLAREGLQDRILYIVLTKGVPLRIAGAPGRTGTASSVDSELALLYRRMTGRAVPVRGRIDNPYFLGAKTAKEARPFSHREQDIYLVTRLDAFTEAEAMALVDRALAPSTEGRIVLDGRDPLGSRTAEEWLEAAAVRLRAEGHDERVTIETTPKPVRGVEQVLGYYSWGSVDPQNRVRRVELGFVPGAIAASYASSDARTFEEPPAGWLPDPAVPGNSTQFAGAAHSLAGDLIREGITGVAAQVAEPLLDGVIRPEILFSAYLAGFTLAEAYYLAMPHLSWQTVVVGDPLCAPFPRARLTRADIDAGVHAGTQLPAFFAGRRLKEVAADAPGAPERAVELAVRADAMLLRRDVAAARKTLAEATALAPNVAVWQFRLAQLEDTGGDYDAAIARYERVLTLTPNDAAALNNLAYALAVRKNDPQRALPLARRAAALSPQSGTVLDTLGWIEHLLGNTEEATKIMASAAKRAPGVPEVRLHAAIVFAAAGARGVAEAELEAALKLDPKLAEREDVKQLRTALAAK